MEAAILSYFVKDDTLHSVCDFNPFPLEKGLSVYEVVRVENGIPLFFKEHVSRFFHSVSLENRKQPYSEMDIKLRIKALIAENKILTGNIKFLCHWSLTGEVSFYAWVVPFFYPSEDQYKKGVFVALMEAERPNPNAKISLHALRQKADEFIARRQCYEVLYVNNDGYITEGSRSNVFFVSDHTLETPESNLVLPGITREKIFVVAKQNKITVMETRINQLQIDGYQACFLTGTSPKVLPVNRLEAKNFNVNHPVLSIVMKGYADLCEEDIKQFSWK